MITSLTNPGLLSILAKLANQITPSNTLNLVFWGKVRGPERPRRHCPTSEYMHLVHIFQVYTAQFRGMPALQGLSSLVAATTDIDCQRGPTITNRIPGPSRIPFPLVPEKCRSFAGISARFFSRCRPSFNDANAYLAAPLWSGQQL